MQRRFPIGAEITKKGTHFRLFAPNSQSVSIEFPDFPPLQMEPEHNGYFFAFAKVPEGTRYRFRLDHHKSFPDPASRYQPDGPREDSQIVNPKSFIWKEGKWKGIKGQNHILYELHVGTFTTEGTWQSAIDKLPHLKELGITLIEMMPIAEFPGKYNWGYDGVNFFAPSHHYGTPDDLRAFVQAAHQLGIGVILDIVYNHFGPSENYMAYFDRDFFIKEATEWGDGLNYQKKEVREFLVTNACYWIEEFHFDGFRFDACHSIFDSSSPHILAEIITAVRKQAGKKQLFISGENEQQDISLIKEYGFNALWNEDFHHAALVRLGKYREAYLSDYQGSPQEFISSAKYGFLYQGQWYRWQKKTRGSPSLDCAPHCFINFLENHDQIANIHNGKREVVLSHPAEYRVMTALLLLLPQNPLLFQGQEFGSSTPFHYFCDFDPQLSKEVVKGRLAFLKQFASLNRSREVQAQILPYDESFKRSKLQWSEKESHSGWFAFFKDLIHLRKIDPIFSECQGRIDGAILNGDAFLLRYFSENGERLLLFNFGVNVSIYPGSEPLLAPPEGKKWQIVWSSEATCYGGNGFISLEQKENWHLSGQCAVILATEQI